MACLLRRTSYRGEGREGIADFGGRNVKRDEWNVTNTSASRVTHHVSRLEINLLQSVRAHYGRHHGASPAVRPGGGGNGPRGLLPGRPPDGPRPHRRCAGGRDRRAACAATRGKRHASLAEGDHAGELVLSSHA